VRLWFGSQYCCFNFEHFALRADSFFDPAVRVCRFLRRAGPTTREIVTDVGSRA
jgi:hypothetical protein